MFKSRLPHHLKHLVNSVDTPFARFLFLPIIEFVRCLGVIRFFLGAVFSRKVKREAGFAACFPFCYFAFDFGVLRTSATAPSACASRSRKAAAYMSSVVLA